MRIIQRLFGTHQRTAANDPEVKAAGTYSRYRGVQVNPGDGGGCAAASALTGQRFLSDDVPSLPLADCDAESCHCTYELFDDRRTDARRVSDVAFDIVGEYYEDEKRNRTMSGRRRSDDDV